MLKALFNRDRFNLYPWYFADQCVTKDIKEIFGKKLNKIVLKFEKGRLSSYGDIEEFNEMGELLLNKIIEDKNFYETVEKNTTEKGEELLNFCESLPKELATLSNKQLAEIYEEYKNLTKKVRVWGWVPPLVDGVYKYFLSDHLQEELKKYMKQIGQEEESPKHYSTLSSSDKMSEVQTEEIERLKLIKEFQINNESLNTLSPRAIESIRKHTKKFAWLTYAYIGPPMNEKDVIASIKNSLEQKETIDQQIENIYNHYENLKRDKQKIIEDTNLPEELKHLCEASASFMYLKDFRKGIYQKSYVLMDPTIEEIAKRLNLTIEQTKYLTDQEIQEALIESKDFADITKERTEYCVAITENGTTKVFTGAEAKKIIENETTEDEIDTNVTELKGSIAFSGKVTGTVKIILLPEDMSKMNEGDVLVSSATNPDLVPAMKKSAAFVTDTGGITSHAAIVSREMKKPCIIGTKIATKVLKDGMKVEVDANEGIVRILSNQH